MALGLNRTTLDFRLDKEIGQAGKNSQVYEAFDLQLEATIVIKQIDKKAPAYQGEYYKEAKILYANEHNNIAKVLYGCEDTQSAFIAMPLYKNGSLKNLIDHRFLTVREIIRYGLQFLSGVHHIHSKGLIHLDIKPDNIFLSDTDEAVLADFGLAKVLDIYNRSNSGFVYNKQIPPEALTTTDRDIKFDIYLCGLTLYKMCNGNVDYDDQFRAFSTQPEYFHAVQNGDFPNRAKYELRIPKSLIKCINKALAINPVDRYDSVLALMNDLASISDQLDWTFNGDYNSPEWLLIKADKNVSIKMSANGNKFDVISKKHMHSSGKVQNIHDFSIANIISQKAITLVRKALKEYS